MGIKTCIVENCFSNSDKNKELAFHIFPANQERRNEWCRIVKESSQGFKQNYKQNAKYVYLWGLHFSTDQYNQVEVSGRNSLKSTGIPSLFSKDESESRNATSRKRKLVDLSNVNQQEVANGQRQSRKGDPATKTNDAASVSLDSGVGLDSSSFFEAGLDSPSTSKSTLEDSVKRTASRNGANATMESDDENDLNYERSVSTPLKEMEDPRRATERVPFVLQEECISPFSSQSGTEDQPEYSLVYESDSEYIVTNVTADNKSPTPAKEIVSLPGRKGEHLPTSEDILRAPSSISDDTTSKSSASIGDLPTDESIDSSSESDYEGDSEESSDYEYYSDSSSAFEFNPDSSDESIIGDLKEKDDDDGNEEEFDEMWQMCSPSNEEFAEMEDLLLSTQDDIEKLRNELATERLKAKKLRESNNKYRVRLHREAKRSAALDLEYTELKSKFDVIGKILTEATRKIKEDAARGDTHATFLLDQLKNYGRPKTGHRWSQLTIKWCIIFHARSSGTYECIRKSRLIKLPCRTNLRMYTGMSTLDVGVPPLALERMELESKHFKEEEMVGTLILDEMAVKCEETLDRNTDKLVGHVNYGGAISDPPPDEDDLILRPSKEKQLANKLLAFVWKSLLTGKKIVVAYFPVRDLKAEELKKITVFVIKEIYKRRFKVWALVADNLSTNVKMYRLFSPNGRMKFEVTNPADENETLFLIFDPSHAIKNVCSQYRRYSFVINGKPVKFTVIKKLYKYQEKKLLVPFRKLTSIHIEPTSIEQQNVGLSTDIFSAKMITALQMMTIENVSGFQDLGGTIEFLKFFTWWFDFMNVSNRTQSIHLRQETKAPYESANDWRLKWLKEVFYPWLTAWKKSGRNKKLKSTLTDQTFQALCVTTRSMVAIIDKIFDKLKPKRFYTSNLLGDDVELLFSAVRQFNGGNYNVALAAAIRALENINRSGIMYTSIHCNVPVHRRKQDGSELIVAARTSRVNEGFIGYLQDVSGDDDCILQSLFHPAGDPSNSVETKLIANAAGHVIHEMTKLPIKKQEELVCEKCFEKMNLGEPSDRPIYSYIRLSDRGGLAYPTLEFIDRLWTVYKFFSEHVEEIYKERRIVSTLANFLLPWFRQCDTFVCDEVLLTTRHERKHQKMIVFILHKFLKALVTNQGQVMTEKQRQRPPAETNKVGNRKLNTFSK